MSAFNKTTNIAFQKFGEVYSESTSKDEFDDNRDYLTIKEKTLDYMYIADDYTYFRVKEGIAMLVVTDDIDKEPETFVIHRICKIKPGLLYNFVSITDESIMEINTQKPFSRVKLQKPFVFYPYSSSLTVNQILGDYYVVRGPNYDYPGEAHNYWEITYIDDGELYTNIDGVEYILKPQEVIFYAPGQRHTQRTKTTCSYLTVVFDMRIGVTDANVLINKVIKVGQKQGDILSFFSKSSQHKGPFLANLLTTSVQMFVVSILYHIHEKQSEQPMNTMMQHKYQSKLLGEILLYIQENIYNVITVEDICMKFSMSRSSLQALFNDNLDVSPKQYISELKFSKAKQMIKESTYSISEISRICGFSSIHYFSRKFKEKYGVTPTSYAKSIG
ncbi:MAG: AraC family transcriptional regulator [Erysipelotrichaceae bacterium]|nr:AraC family transcriptional regulator [Erysipelotrichaceae bacterium]